MSETNRRTVISTGAAPKAIGPYSQAVRAGGLVFCSGQIPLDPASGELVSADVGEQTRQVLKNLSAVLEAAGSDLRSVVKTTIFLADMGDFARVNEVYKTFFVEEPPARATVEVGALPKDSRVEIEAIAIARQA
jgi:2-iminobutanoate/2-iminopropanoate deaminase